MVTSCPVFCFQWVANALLIALKSSRVGSYDTLSKVTGLAAGLAAGPWAAAGAAAAPSKNSASARFFIAKFLSVSIVGASEGGLEPRDHSILRLPVARRAAAGEGGALVVHRDLDRPVEVPV